MEGAKAFGSRSHRPVLCGQDGLQLSHDGLFDNGITGNSQPAVDLWFCEKERPSFGGDIFPGFSGVFGQWIGGPGPSGVVERNLQSELLGHMSRDSTAIEGREKPVASPRKKRRHLVRGGVRRGRKARVQAVESIGAAGDPGGGRSFARDSGKLRRGDQKEFSRASRELDWV